MFTMRFVVEQNGNCVGVFVYSSFVSIQWWSQHKYWNFPGHAGNFQSSRQTTASGCVETCKIYVDKDVHKPTCIAQRVTVNRIVVSLYLYILSQKHSIQFVSFFSLYFQQKMSQVITARLSRNDAQPWGFRLQGGKDFGTPLVIQKVSTLIRTHFAACSLQKTSRCATFVRARTEKILLQIYWCSTSKHFDKIKLAASSQRNEIMPLSAAIYSRHTHSFAIIFPRFSSSWVGEKLF